MGDLGKLVPPYPRKTCQNASCEKVLADAAFLFTEVTTQKFVIFCGECALWIELQHHDRFLLVPL